VAVPTGYTGQTAVAIIRARTGQTSTQPSDTTIVTFLNAGVEQVERMLGAIYATANQAIAKNANTVPLPADMQSIINLNYSMVLPTAANAVLYPIQLLQEGAFERLVGYLPSQSIGFPSYAFVQSDVAVPIAFDPAHPAPVSTSGVMTLQLDGMVQTAGFINVYYKQRPAVWADATVSSATNIDSSYQELAILWACMNVCENRAMYGRPVEYFLKRFETELQRVKEDQQMRQIPQRAVVADVSMTPIGSPPWAAWDS
jgi:hypothetical protein